MWQHKTRANFRGKPLFQSDKTAVKTVVSENVLIRLLWGVLNAWSVWTDVGVAVQRFRTLAVIAFTYSIGLLRLCLKSEARGADTLFGTQKTKQ